MKLYTARAVARRLGIEEKEVIALTKTGVIKKGYTDRGLYQIEETAKEIIANYRKPEEERENVDYATERAKMMRVKRLDAELSLKVRKGELYEPEDIKAALSKTLVSFKTRLLAIPTRAASRAAEMENPADIADMLKGLIEESLDEMANFDLMYNEDAEENGEESS